MNFWNLFKSEKQIKEEESKAFKQFVEDYNCHKSMIPCDDYDFGAEESYSDFRIVHFKSKAVFRSERFNRIEFENFINCQSLTFNKFLEMFNFTKVFESDVNNCMYSLWQNKEWSLFSKKELSINVFQLVKKDQSKVYKQEFNAFNSSSSDFRKFCSLIVNN